MVLLALLGITSCGGKAGVSDAGLTHIQGSSESISRGMLDHWMHAMAGGDFRAIIGTKGPKDLVAEPADYPGCMSAAEKIVPRSFTGKPKLSDQQIAFKCHQLYSAIKEQAISFLISVQWTVIEGAEQGLKVSNAQLQREFARYRKHVYPTEADLSGYLAERNWVRSDVLYQLKRNILVTAILPKFEARVKKAGGGEKVYAKLALERYKALIARTKCQPGFIAPNCSEYREPSSAAPSPNVILEALVKGQAS
jgi:hypothetical protein